MQSESSVLRVDDEEIEDAGRRRPNGDVPRERRCMACGSTFASEGWHNRLCGQCRKRSEVFE